MCVLRARSRIRPVTTVRFLGPDTDAYVASVERHAAEFEEQTGIELDITIVPSDLYFSNRIEHLLDGEEAADVYMSGPVLALGASRRGLRPAARRSARAGERRPTTRPTSSSRCCAATAGAAASAIRSGEGPLLEIPGQLRVVQPRVRARGSRARGARACRPPGTSTSRRHARSSSGPTGEVRGFAQRGTAAWHTMYTGFATQLWSYGARDFVDGRCAIASPAVGAGHRRLPGGAARRRPDRTGSTSAGTSSRWTSDAAGTG